MVERGLVSTRYGHIHYRHHGRAHPRAVILSHISQQSSADMLELVEALAPKVHAIAFDYPSCGMSDHFLMGEQFHYRKDLDALAAHARDATAEVIPGARFCVTWSDAAWLARRTFELMGP
jgi:pimeloyl-ACP methyl ester carboxylesterase